jgi:hypothetical protein
VLVIHVVLHDETSGNSEVCVSIATRFACKYEHIPRREYFRYYDSKSVCESVLQAKVFIDFSMMQRSSMQECPSQVGLQTWGHSKRSYAQTVGMLRTE